jgi:hypothetical protein
MLTIINAGSELKDINETYFSASLSGLANTEKSTG